MNKTALRGIFYGALSAACYGLNPLFAVPLLNQGIGVFSVLFFRFSVAALSVGILLGVRRQSFLVSRKEFGLLALMSILMTSSSISLFYAYTLIPAGIASTLLFLYPIFVSAIMIAFFHEKFSWKMLLAILTAFAGVALLCLEDSGDGNASGGMLNPWGVGVVAISALTYAVYLVAVNRTRLGGMSGTKLSFYILLFGSVLLGAAALVTNGGIDVPADAVSWLNVLLLATVPTLASTIAIVFALRYVGATITAILGAFEPVAAVIAGVLALGEPLTGTLAAGMALIISAVAVIVLSRKSA